MPTVRIGRNEIHYREEGKGFPVAMIHGLAGDHTAWLAQLEILKSSFRVVIFDNRGAGRSTQIDEPVTTLDLAHDTIRLLDALGIDRAHIVGRSMGGAIAQHVALLKPDLVQSLVLCASFARLDPLGRRVLSNMREVLEWQLGWPAHARHSVANFVSVNFYNGNPDQVRAIEKLIGGETRLPACYIQQNHACQNHDTLETLTDIRCPTLVMSGAVDPICSPVCTEWMTARLPDCRSVVFEDASHFFLLEYPQRFNSELVRWLQTHSPDG